MSRELRGLEVGRDSRLKPFREIDYRALRLISDRCEATALKKRFILKNLDNRWKKGQLFSGRESTEQLWRMCEARMMLGNFKDWTGWQYRDPWSAGLWHNPVINGIKPWDGLPVNHLYVIGEQGVGDELFFAQALPACLLIANRVTHEGDPRIIPALKRMGVHNPISSDFVWEGFDKHRKMMPIEADAWIPGGDLPRVFLRLKDVVPPLATNYITPDPEQVKKYARYRGRIGISWRGAQGHYKASEFARLAGDRALSLQYDQSPLEKVERPDVDLRDDFEGIFGLLANLDGIITVSTTVAHMAFSMGVPGDVILAPMNGRHQNMLNWKYSTFRKSPWYPSATVWQNLREYCAEKGLRYAA